MSDRRSSVESLVTYALHKAADGVSLSDEFRHPGASALALMRHHRKVRVRNINILAGVLTLVMAVGMAVAAQARGSWLWWKTPPTDAELVMIQETVQADSQALAQSVLPAEAASAEVGQLSLSMPVSPSVVVDNYGPRISQSGKVTDRHTGVDFSVHVGDAVYAAADGVVTAAGSYPSLGNVVVITHGKVNGAPVSTWYEHNEELKVQVGQKVARGGVIALAGNTGSVSGPNLHFELRVSGSPVNPLTWVK